MTPSSERPAPRPLRDWLAGPALLVLGPLALFLAGFIWLLWPEWTDNPDLSHGLFAPLIFALLVREGWAHGTRRWVPERAWVTVGVGVALAAALIAFAMAGLLAASLGWSHSVVKFLLACALAAALGGGLLILAGERVRAVPFNWPVLTAIALWVLASPLPPGAYARLTLELQAWVTTGVLNALHILGIPARQSGNVIELANTSVGVEEACSGIRSLLSCLYAGVFFSGWLVRRYWARALLITIAPLLAIAMNYLRSLLLTLLANRGVDINGFWHDTTGFAILGITAALLALLASWLSEDALTPAPAGVAPDTAVVQEPAPSASSVRAASWVFAGGSAVLVAVGLFFAFYPRSTEVRTADIAFEPDRLLPVASEGWQVVTAQDLYQFSETLQTEHLAQRTYLRRRGERVEQLTVYIAHWAPGQVPVSMVASHTPDACWPGSGWVAQTNATPRLALDLAGRALPPAEYRLFTRGPAAQHVWFWHIFDGRVINYRDPYSIPALLELGLRYGFRREGSQYFVRMSSNLPWSELAAEPLLRQLQDNLAPLGLTP